MAKGGAKAVAHLRWKGGIDLICRYHFLAAVGKKLFEQPYALLRKLLKSSKVRTDLRALLRDLRRVIGEGNAQDWTAPTIELGDGKDGYHCTRWSNSTSGSGWASGSSC